MNSEQVLHLTRMTLEAALMTSAPMLLVMTVVSVLISVAQVMTSIQDQTINTVPRLFAVATCVFFLLPWMLRHMAEFTVRMFSDFHPFLQ